MRRLTYTTKTMTLHNALEALTLRGSYNVHIISAVEHLYGQRVTEIEFLFETTELGQVTLGGNTSLLEVTEQRSRSILLLCLLETYLNGSVTILLNALDLGYHARTYFDYSARHILAVGTEHGCHSDFLT